MSTSGWNFIAISNGYNEGEGGEASGESGESGAGNMFGIDDFKRFDVNDDGQLNVEEVDQAFLQLGFSNPVCNFEDDANTCWYYDYSPANGGIELDEFIEMMAAEAAAAEEAARKAAAEEAARTGVVKVGGTFAIQNSKSCCQEKFGVRLPPNISGLPIVALFKAIEVLMV